MRGQKFEHAAGSRARVQEMLDRYGRQMADDGGLDILFGRMESADASPFRGIGLEIGSRFGGPGFAYRGQPCQICVVGTRRKLGKRGTQRRTLPFVGGAIEDPASFFEPLDQTGTA